ncbi:serine/threonine-protein kinase [Streptomyces herbicida]|uniref:serine/threonine-protein kinase n=1 Tax=Streptomyces herbicida TaxID=3065675 RepID=UPI0029302245|nr:serine/threonine-protein kinase [Streptomyces sp. NEAU-HV9]
MKTWSVPGFTEIRELGTGGSGRVVMAVEAASGTRVAIKYLNERLTGDARFLQDFRAEAQLLREVDSPHVARLHRYVESRDGAAMVLDLVDGLSLRALLRQEGATTPEAALTVLKGSLLGLSAAHHLGIVHRDYKPENVLVTTEATSKLVDFGIAARDGSAPAGTAGTPVYMAPEQWEGHPASPATDVYAATVTFFECVTGTRPFGGEHLAEIAVRHMSAPVPAEAAPEPVRALVLRGMAKSPYDRFRSADDFLAELETAAAAGYGPDWEKRGMRALAALIAALLLEMPQAPAGGADATTELATTDMDEEPAADHSPRRTRGQWRRPGKVPVTIAAAVLLAGAAVAVSVTGNGSARNSALTAPGSGSGSGDGASGSTWPSTHDAAEDDPEASSSPADGSRAPGTPDSRGASAETRGQRTAGGSTRTSAPGDDPAAPSQSTASQQPTASPTASPAAMAVRSVGITSLQESAQGRGADATVTVTTTGTEPVSLTLTWYDSDQADTPGQQDGSSETYRLSGRTSYQLSYHHDFTTCPRYWGLQVSTTPDAESGKTYRDMDALACILQPRG